MKLLVASTLALLLTALLGRAEPDYYGLMGMTRETFDKPSLLKQYRRLAKQHHPDKNKGDKQAEAKFVQLTKAFEVLNDDQKRSIYDRYGADAVDKHAQGGGGGHAQDFRHAEDIFNSYGAAKPGRSPA